MVRRAVRLCNEDFVFCFKHSGPLTFPALVFPVTLPFSTHIIRLIIGHRQILYLSPPLVAAAGFWWKALSSCASVDNFPPHQRCSSRKAVHLIRKNQSSLAWSATIIPAVSAPIPELTTRDQLASIDFLLRHVTIFHFIYNLTAHTLNLHL
jgi:hypothetical protein